MQWWEAIVLGLVQGLTEFLPVSSSGHLLMFEHWFGLQHTPLTFDILLHLGTLGAVVLFFWPQLRQMSRQMMVKIVIASLPLVGGVLLKDSIESLRGSLVPLIITYALTAGLLFMADQVLRATRGQTWLTQVIATLHRWLTRQEQPSAMQAFMVGLFQVMALLPGVSRSGATVSAGILSGISPKQAFAFSFLISIPAVLGAVILDLSELVTSADLATLPWDLYLLGTMVSAVSGWLALYLLRWFVSKRMLWPFAVYAAGVSILLVFLV